MRLLRGQGPIESRVNTEHDDTEVSVFTLEISRFCSDGPELVRPLHKTGLPRSSAVSLVPPMTTDRQPDPSFDPRKRFIRLVERRADGMVEFEFAVGEPELFVEMLLPQAAFEAFCAAQGVAVPVSPLAPAASDAVAADSLDEQARRDLQWTLHDAVARPGGPHPH